MINRRNYYRILHIQPDAPELLIKASYRTLMQKLKMHPDLGGSHWNAALVNEAYNVLSDPVRRQHYDKKLLGELNLNRFHQEDTVKEYYKNSMIQSKHQLIKHFCLFCKTPYQPEQQYLQSAVCFECRSPLRSNKEEGRENYQNRLLERKSVDNLVNYYNYWPQNPSEGKIFDVSPKGVGFSVNHKISIKSILKLECDSFEAVIEVMHCDFKPEENELSFAIGAEFLTVSFEHPKGGFLSVNV